MLRYASDEAELARLSAQAKQWSCLHCGRIGTLNAHGFLRGVAENLPGKDALRGQRFFCSNRGHRPGCGRTTSVLLAQVLRYASVRTGSFWRFCEGRLFGLSVLAAWEKARCVFSLESVYRWWRRWRRAEPAVRTQLFRGREPPGDLLTAITGTYGAVDPLAVFQAREQRVWPGFAS
jgi:hypothetical protein